MRRPIIILFLLTLVFAVIPQEDSPSPLAALVLRFDPATVEVGPGYCVGETFTLAARIDNVEDLAGLGLQITWNTTYLEYVSHTMMIPVEEHPDGILHKPVIIVADLVNEVHGTYDCAASTLGGAPFYGNGIAFEVTLRVKHQPEYLEPDVHFLIKFTLGDLAPSACGAMPHYTEHCNITIHAYSPTIVRSDPATVELGPNYCVDETFILEARIDDVTNLAQFSFHIVWNTTYFDYVNHMIKAPVEAYADGVLHEPIYTIIDLANATSGFYKCSVYTLGGGPFFTGSGTALEITFRLKQQPIYPEPDESFTIKFILHDLVDEYTAIPHSIEHCNVAIHAYPNWSIADLNWDLKVDIADIILASGAYGSTPEESDWNPLVDVAPLWNRIDIFDLVTIAYHYGEEYPS